MKKCSLFISLLLIADLLTAGQPTTIKMIASSGNSTTIEFIPGELKLKNVTTQNGTEQIAMIDNGTPLLEAGAPDLQKLTRSLIIPDLAKMEVKVISSTFYDLTGINIAPSKGNLFRNIDPSTVPYTYSNISFQNSFFPSSIVSANSPYILRDHRGQAIHVCPFQYNPQTKVLRVYTNVVVEVSVAAFNGGENPFERTSDEKFADAEFEAIYQRQFINYNDHAGRYSAVAENGSMLVICYDAFSPDIQPFVNWKNRKGIPTELVLKSAVGTTAAAIKTFITNYYSSHPNLKYVLFVGDAPQIPASSKADAWGTTNDSDNNYGYLTGSDSYPEVFIGRFSATTNTHVQTMVMRTMNYEETPQASAAWYKKGITIGSDQGPGDDGEMDFEHQRVIAAKLLSYSYSNMSENFDGSQGGLDASGNPAPALIASGINSGAGIISYTGHGSDFSFGTSGFSVSDINSSLTNTSMHPFIWSVACVNGNFVANTTCFAEAWLRAGTPSAPKGALSALMSTINQSWNPPMEGQDAMVDILVESVSGNIKRTFGGISMNGCMQMNDAYGNDGDQMTDTWTLFGDPSVMVFSDSPAQMLTSHVPNTPLGTTSITVNNNTSGALICLSAGGTILGTGVSDGTLAVITIPAATAGVIDVVATAYNKMPYSGIINVNAATGISEKGTNDNLNVYPNPSSTKTFTLNFSVSNGSDVQIRILNVLGSVVYSENLQNFKGNYNKKISLEKLSPGIYFTDVIKGNERETVKVTLE
jgi:hypothetical protein